MDIFWLAYNGVKHYRNRDLDIIDDFFSKALEARRWIDRNKGKTKLLLKGKNLKTRQQKYYYKGV